MTLRRRALLQFLAKEGRCSKIRLAKVMFLKMQDWKMGTKFYSFVPYKYGPYSFELFHDVEVLESENIVTTDENHVAISEGITVENMPSISFDDKILNLDDSHLVDFIYNRYPEYTIFSKLRKKKKYTRDRTGAFTIGYEGLSIDEFLKLMIDEKVDLLADVRNNPWSMKYGYTRETLDTFCRKLRINYQSIPSLGVPAPIRNRLKETNDYPQFFKEYQAILPSAMDEITDLVNTSKNQRIAIMCFEKDPACCHRSMLGKELSKQGVEVEIR